MEYEDYRARYADGLPKMNTTFDVYWNSDNFEVYTADQEVFLQQEIDAIRHPASADNGNLYSFRIRPYPYQQTILDNLEAERTLRNRWKIWSLPRRAQGKRPLPHLITPVLQKPAAADDKSALCGSPRRDLKAKPVLFPPNSARAGLGRARCGKQSRFPVGVQVCFHSDIEPAKFLGPDRSRLL